MSVKEMRVCDECDRAIPRKGQGGKVFPVIISYVEGESEDGVEACSEPCDRKLSLARQKVAKAAAENKAKNEAKAAKKKGG